MNLLEWKSEYSVGIASMDDDHREMIDLINNVYAKLGAAPETAAIEECMESIFTTISMHFALEERLMREAGYDEYVDHKDDHEELLDEVRELMDLFIADADNAADLLSEHLNAWFAVHFSSYDARLHGKLGPH